MSEFTERLRKTPTIRLESLAARIALDEAADIIDEMERALRICGNAFEYLGIDENQVTFYAPTAIRDVLNKLER